MDFSLRRAQLRLAHSNQYVTREIRTPAAGTLAAHHRDFGTSALAASKEITPVHTIAEVRKPLAGLVRPD
jgi:hypothetical protein